MNVTDIYWDSRWWKIKDDDGQTVYLSRWGGLSTTSVDWTDLWEYWEEEGIM